MMNLFFDIPKVHQVDLLAGWLQPEDVVKLDMAVMCHKHRKELIDLLHSPECVLGYLEFMWEGTMEWVIARQVKFSSIAISNRLLSDGEIVEKVIQIIGPTLKSFDYNCNISEDDEDDDESADPVPISLDQIMYFYVRYLTNLESLRLNNGAVDGMLSVLISNNRSTLKTFELSECDNVSASILKACCDSPRLEEITIVSCEFTEDAFRFNAATNTTCRNLQFSGELFSDQIANFVSRFSHLRSVEAHLTAMELVSVSHSCALMEHAKITIFSALAVPEATSVAQNWKHIVQLQILRAESGTHVCDQNVVLLFIKQCPTLQQLILAPPLENTDFEPTVSPTATEPRPARSRLTELTVSQLSKRSLGTIVQKCPDMQSLCIHRPAATHLGASTPDQAEGALVMLNNTKITHLYLGNWINFATEYVDKLYGLEKLVLQNVGDALDFGTHDGSALIQLAHHCTRLHTLHLQNCPIIQYNSVLPLLQAATRVVDFEYSVTAVGRLLPPSISELVLEQAMYRLFPRLVKFHMRS